MVEKINITFLGTGSAIPTARRNHPAMLLRYKSENILVDCGEGTQRQFRKAHINPCKITKLLITHWHADHVLGIPGLIQTMMLNGYNKKLEVYGPRGTKAKFEQYLDLFIHKENELDIVIKEINNEVFFDNEEFCLEAAKMDHDCPAIAYSFTVKEKSRLDKEKLKELNIPNSPLVAELVEGKTIEINGKKINGKKLIYTEKARKITFIMDTRINENAIQLAENSDLLICESTYSKDEEEIASEHGHMTSIEAATIAKEAKVKALVLTHLSQRYEAIPKVILTEAKEVFKDVIIPEDLESVEL